jgi:hypothetical protein
LNGGRTVVFYGRSEELVMRVPYRVEGSTFINEKPQVWMRIPRRVLWTEPSLDGTRAVGIRAIEARPEAIVLMVNFFEQPDGRIPARPGSDSIY